MAVLTFVLVLVFVPLIGASATRRAHITSNHAPYLSEMEESTPPQHSQPSASSLAETAENVPAESSLLSTAPTSSSAQSISSSTIRQDIQVITCNELVRHEVAAEVDGHPICVYEKGDPSAEHTIVLIHGRTWSSLPVFDLKYESAINGDGVKELVNLSTMDQLVANGIRVFAIDLRGFGGTLRDNSGWITPAKAVMDIKSVICWMKKTKGINTPCLLGWSQGGLVSHLFAQRFPHKISSIIFYASIFDPKVIHHRTAFLHKPLQPKKLKTSMDMALEDFTLHGSISDEAGYAFGLSALKADPIKPDWCNLYEFNDINPAKVAVPSLVIHGDDDPYLVKEGQMGLYAGISSSDKCYTIIPGADHCAHLIGAKHAFIHNVVSFIKRPKNNYRTNDELY